MTVPRQTGDSNWLKRTIDRQRFLLLLVVTLIFFLIAPSLKYLGAGPLASLVMTVMFVAYGVAGGPFETSCARRSRTEEGSPVPFIPDP